MAELLRRFAAYYRPHRRLFVLDFGGSCAVIGVSGRRAQMPRAVVLGPCSGDQVLAPPAHHTMNGRNWTALHKLSQRFALRVVQFRPSSGHLG
jgi:hypothetical protein